MAYPSEEKHTKAVLKRYEDIPNPRLREVIDMAFADASARNVDLRSVNLEIDPVNLM